MKQIINGLRYDTDTATCLAEWQNFDGDLSDFNYIEESLHVTKSGRYFLYVAGGANTEYAEHHGNGMYSGSENLRPITEQEAFVWCQDHDAIDVIEERFADMIQDA